MRPRTTAGNQNGGVNATSAKPASGIAAPVTSMGQVPAAIGSGTQGGRAPRADPAKRRRAPGGSGATVGPQAVQQQQQQPHHQQQQPQGLGSQVPWGSAQGQQLQPQPPSAQLPAQPQLPAQLAQPAQQAQQQQQQSSNAPVVFSLGAAQGSRAPRADAAKRRRARGTSGATVGPQAVQQQQQPHQFIAQPAPQPIALPAAQPSAQLAAQPSAQPAQSAKPPPQQQASTVGVTWGPCPMEVDVDVYEERMAEANAVWVWFVACLDGQVDKMPLFDAWPEFKDHCLEPGYLVGFVAKLEEKLGKQMTAFWDDL